MAKSQILKDLANNTVALDVALRRLMIICSDLNYDEIYNWAEKELNGYEIGDPVPLYRKQRMGQILYSGLKGSMINCLQLTNQPLPSHCIPKSIQEALHDRYDRDPISSIIEKANSNQKYKFDFHSCPQQLDG